MCHWNDECSGIGPGSFAGAAGRVQDLYTRIRAISVAGFAGIVPFLVAAATTDAPAIIYRAILIAIFPLLTSTVATHAIAHVAHLRGEDLEPPGGRDGTETPGR